MPYRDRNPRTRQAFTLVELMIAVALMLLLMVGINVIFSMTGKAVGAGQALSDNIRSAQAVQSVMSRDFETIAVNDGPCILIQSKTQPAFRNRLDMLSDRDYNPADTLINRQRQIRTTDIDGDNVEGSGVGETTPHAIYNSRNHRVDILSFFSRDLHHRQTGGGTFGGSAYQPLIADMTSNEAWIWYGHLHLPDNNGSFTVDTEPGAGTFGSNPNNFFASQWILGRMAVLLKEPARGVSGAGTIVTSDGVSHDFIDRPLPVSPFVGPLYPLQANSMSTNYGGESRQFQLREGRYDLAGTDLRNFKKIINDLISVNGVGYNWWQPLMLSSRFQGNPVLLRPITSTSYAQQAPIFLPSCTQFIVEYAGDFVKQNRDPNDTSVGGTGDAEGVYGDVQDAYFVRPTDPTDAYEIKPVGEGTDGEIDFFVLNPGTANARKQIRWYGLPRDTDGDGVIAGVPNPAALRNNGLRDVVPLLDVVRTQVSGQYSTANRTPAERLFWNPAPWGPPTPNPTLTTGKADYANLSNGMSATTSALEYYTAAFGPRDRKPWLIRITLVIDDPNGRLGEGQTFEMIFRIQ